MIISIGGVPGSGKSTVAIMLAEKLGFKRYYMGDIYRQMARERGMTVDEFRVLGSKDPQFDRKLDKYQEELGQKEDDFVIEGRTSYFFIPHSIKVYLDVNLQESARRRLHDTTAGAERNELKPSTVEETAKVLKERLDNETISYKKWFGTNLRDMSNYDVVINTTSLTPKQVLDKILAFIKDKIPKKA